MALKKAKDLYRCVKNIDSFSDGQAKVLSWDCDTMSSVTVELKPNGGIYKGGAFVFKFYLPESFPQCRPNVSCTTMVYHPNIDPTNVIDADDDDYEGGDDNVCLNLFDEWEPTFGLEDCIQGLLFLFYHPNIEDPLSPLFDSSLDEAEYEINVKNSLRGISIDSYEFPVNYEEDEEEKEMKEIVKTILDELVGNVFESIPETTNEINDNNKLNSKDNINKHDDNSTNLIENNEVIIVNTEEFEECPHDSGKPKTDLTVNCDNVMNGAVNNVNTDNSEYEKAESAEPECDMPTENTDTEKNTSESTQTNEDILNKIEKLVEIFEEKAKENGELDEDASNGENVDDDAGDDGVNGASGEEVGVTVRNAVEGGDEAASAEVAQSGDESSQNISSGSNPVTLYTRQSSKILRVDSVIDDDNDDVNTTLVVPDHKEDMGLANGNNCFAINCTCVAPDYDYMLNMVGAVFYNMVKSVIR